MAKGFFTQGVCVLLSRAATLDEIEPLLREFRIVRRIDDAQTPDMGGPSFTVAFRPDVNGYVSVDIQNRPWPDHMGDPKTEPMLFGAWSMGHFGPLAFPGNLLRAAQQSWSWEGAKGVPAQHRAFLRVRSSYVFGAADDAKVIPEEYDPLAELHFVTKVARALLRLPSALAYFNPNGETLLSGEMLDESLDFHAQHQLPPLNIWCNVRLFNPGNGWLLMDTVGMGQLDRPDCEACFPDGAYRPGEVDNFFRNCSTYLLEHGEVVKHGDTMNGPGGVNWRAHHVEEPLAEPPRAVLRWFPVDGSRPPPEMIGSLSA
jgi:hypothetical protein